MHLQRYLNAPYLTPLPPKAGMVRALGAHTPRQLLKKRDLLHVGTVSSRLSGPKRLGELTQPQLCECENETRWAFCRITKPNRRFSRTDLATAAVLRSLLTVRPDLWP